ISHSQKMQQASERLWFVETLLDADGGAARAESRSGVWDILAASPTVGHFPKSQRDFASKPRVARNELPWVDPVNDLQPQRGCVSIPHIAFVPFDLMFAQQRP